MDMNNIIVYKRAMKLGIMEMKDKERGMSKWDGELMLIKTFEQIYDHFIIKDIIYYRSLVNVFHIHYIYNLSLVNIFLYKTYLLLLSLENQHTGIEL